MLLNLSLLGTLGLVSIAVAKTISVDVGDSGFTFSPDTITADVGDDITFTVYTTHSVVEGDGFDNPCAFKPGGFFSGFSTGKETFTIAVTSKDPIWLYCAAPAHCQGGMVAVVNPSGGNTLAAYKAAAANAPPSTNPGSPSGGVSVAPPGSSSSSGTAASSASESSVASSASSSSAPTSESSAQASSTEAAATSTAGTNATVSRTVAPPPVVQTTNAAVSTFTEETVLVNVFVGLVAVVAGWAGLL